jgi:hypothetical protein
VATLVIHDFRKDYFELNLAAYTLTFDDGLYSQYYYYPLLDPVDSPKIFFIITSFIKPGKARERFNGEFIKSVKSRKYMNDAFINNDFSHFMTLEEIQELATHKGVKIGTHSHFHDVIIHFQGFELRDGKLVPRKETEWMDYIKYDTELSLKWFEENLWFKPEIYGLPFNEYSDRMIAVLESFGFKEFYGKSSKNKKIHARLDIDKL